MTDVDVSQWIGQLPLGDELAAQKIWDLYYQKLVRVARKKLGDSAHPAADEEDVALSAFHSPVGSRN